MSWQKYVMIGWFALAIVLQIAMFHKPSPKKTAQALAISVLLSVGLIALVVSA